MFREILKIIPKMDAKDLNALEKTLQGRFTRIAKKFGKGLLAAVKGGGVVGIALGLIDKLLNPLQDTQEAIERTLKSSDDIVTNAKQFGTTAGKLAKLQAFAQSSGLDADNLSVLITKFQTAVAEAKQDPSKASSVRNFTEGEDSADAFFQFIQALQKMDKTQQLLVQQEVFGEKQILKMADFLQSDFGNLNNFFAKFDSEKLTQSLNKLGNLNDRSDTLGAVRGLDDINKKAGVVNQGMIDARDRSERIALDRENQRIRSYQDLRAISDTTAKMMTLVEEGIGQLGKFINFLTPTLNRIVDAIEKFSKSSILKSIFGRKGD